MGTDFTQDTVLHYLQSSGGSVKNSDLLLHFRSFIRDHEDRDRYRDLFKKFVNSVATVQQLDGVSYVVLRKKFKGYVPGRGGQEGVAVRPSGQPRPPADRTPAAATASPARSTDKPLQKPPKLREGTTTTPAPPGGTPAGRTVLPAAGIMLPNNNNKVETNVSQKQEQQTMITPQVHIRPTEAAKEVLSTPLQGTTVGQHRGGLKLDPPPGITPDVRPDIRPAAAQVMNQISQRTDLKIPNLSELPGRNKSPSVAQLRGLDPPPGITPVVSAVKHQGETSQQVPVPQPLRGREVCLQPQKGLHEDPPIHHGGPEPQIAPRRFRHRPSYKSALSYDDDEDELEEEVVPMRRGSGGGGAWPLGAPLGDMEKAMSASSPCILDPRGPPSPDSSSREKKIPKICIQHMEGEPMPRPGGGPGLGSGVGHRGQWSRPSPDRAKEVAPRREVNVDLQYSQHPGVQMMEPRPGPDQSQRERLSSSHSTGLPRTDRSPPGSSPRGPGWNSSHEDLQSRAGKPMGGREIQEVLQRAQQTNIDRTINKTTAPWHHSAGHLHDHQEPTASSSPFHHSNDHLHDNKPSADRVFPLHQSTGDLYDDPESSGGSASSPPPWQHPAVARRLSSHRRNRMCRSVGADLDQILPEGGSEAARLNRLHMISSSLSLRYNLSTSSLSSCSTPPRCTSLADLTEGPEEERRRRLHTTTSSSFHPECPSSRQSLVPLEPREHAWLVKGAAGSWPDIYSLFREDPSLLNRQDFISGFTVLHWIAKHGDHRVLNTLWYGVEKAGLSFDINSRSTCGHTPLHIAAMHGHKNIVRLLVNRFSADARLRDTAGKKPWQYLSRAMPPDVFTLLGAPVRAVLDGGGTVDPTTGAKQELLQPHPQSQQRRRRHHLSMASSRERPLTTSGTTRVKRSSSIAAFLKHKSLLTFHGHKSDSSLEKS